MPSQGSKGLPKRTSNKAAKDRRSRSWERGQKRKRRNRLKYNSPGGRRE